jgi:trehalose utilization protein
MTTLRPAPIRVTVWGENIQEHEHPVVARIYPVGMHTCIAAALNADERLVARTATLQEPEHGLSADVLEATDVLIWWGHGAHDQVQDAVVDRIQTRVLEGMGLIVLHSAHFSKIFRRLIGTSGSLRWREAGERERLWVCNPGHPIARGVGPQIVIPHEEMYGEPFGIPTPDDVVFLAWFEGGDVFRAGVTFTRGAGRIFYFQPGHETYPTFHQPEIQQVLRNACVWAATDGDRWADPHAAPMVPEAAEEIRTANPHAPPPSAST